MNIKVFLSSFGGIAVVHFIIVVLARAGVTIAGTDLGSPTYKILGQPAKFAAEQLSVGNGSAGFWLILIANSLLWAAVISFVIAKIFKK